MSPKLEIMEILRSSQFIAVSGTFSRGAKHPTMQPAKMGEHSAEISRSSIFGPICLFPKILLPGLLSPAHLDHDAQCLVKTYHEILHYNSRLPRLARHFQRVVCSQA